MSRSWTPEPPRRDVTDRAPGAGRGQVEPTVALVAMFAVCVGVGLHAAVIDGTLAIGDDRDLSEPTLRRVYDRVGATGVVDSDALSESLAVGPDGYRLNVTLLAADRRYSAGPRPPNDADTARRSVSVRTAPGRAVPGVLRVAVWR